ncbi:MAG TPA: ribosome maturation factor RimM [Bryobacteraceae bacterium]|nr:ribosome maturation factor RimM [Bryobacteraceae bacterium]
MIPPRETGSSQEWVTIAILGRARGNRGELTALPLSSRPERYHQLEEVFLFGDGSPYRVESTWWHENRLILKFEGVDSISAAELLSGAEVRIPRSQRFEPEADEYFLSDLVGCEVIERKTGDSLGTVANWLEGGGSGLLELTSGLLIPFAKAICVEIDPAARRIGVDLPEGLKELNRE